MNDKETFEGIIRYRYIDTLYLNEGEIKYDESFFSTYVEEYVSITYSISDKSLELSFDFANPSVNSNVTSNRINLIFNQVNCYINELGVFSFIKLDFLKYSENNTAEFSGQFVVNNLKYDLLDFYDFQLLYATVEMEDLINKTQKLIAISIHN